MSYIICHYAEIGLKGKNRRFFEEKLIENIKRVLPPVSFALVKRISGRILVKLSEKREGGTEEIVESLKKVFGIAYFAIATECGQDIKSIQKKAVEVLAGKKFKTFKVACQRSKKDYPLTSQEVNEGVGEDVLKNFQFSIFNFQSNSKYQIPNSRIKVDLEKPDITLFIELVERYTFLYTEKIKGPGGLPLGVSGRAAALLSGGIDSPVAAFLAMKRGVRVIFVHFHAYPYTDKASIEKVKKIVQLLNQYQHYSILYLVPFGDIQKEILLKTPARLRVILYRRMMFRIAQQIAKKEKALVLITGENIGQVASQTLENIRVIEEATGLPILRPVIGQDKEEIIKMARAIGTYELSILPHQDCCARFLPQHPETKARIEEVKKAEKKLNIKKLLQKGLSSKTIHGLRSWTIQ